jgi:hypothetical protein
MEAGHGRAVPTISAMDRGQSSRLAVVSLPPSCRQTSSPTRRSGSAAARSSACGPTSTSPSTRPRRTSAFGCPCPSPAPATSPLSSSCTAPPSSPSIMRLGMRGRLMSKRAADASPRTTTAASGTRATPHDGSWRCPGDLACSSTSFSSSSASSPSPCGVSASP